MKPSTKVNFLMFAGSVFLMLGVFAKPMGVSSDFDSIFSLIAIIFIYFGYRTSQKAKAAGQMPSLSDSKKRKRFVLIAVPCAMACIAFPFIAPSLGVSLPFGELIVISIISFFISMGAMWFGMKRS